MASQIEQYPKVPTTSLCVREDELFGAHMASPKSDNCQKRRSIYRKSLEKIQSQMKKWSLVVYGINVTWGSKSLVRRMFDDLTSLWITGLEHPLWRYVRASAIPSAILNLRSQDTVGLGPLPIIIIWNKRWSWREKERGRGKGSVWKESTLNCDMTLPWRFCSKLPLER